LMENKYICCKSNWIIRNDIIYIRVLLNNDAIYLILDN
jgi:hypothetical protein